MTRDRATQGWYFFLHDLGHWLRSCDDGGPAGALLAADDGVGAMWVWMGMPVAVGQGQFDLQQGPPSILCEWHRVQANTRRYEQGVQGTWWQFGRGPLGGTCVMM